MSMDPPAQGGAPLPDAEEFVERAIESVLEQVPDVADEEPEGSAKLQPWAETAAPPSKNKRPLAELLEQYAERVRAQPEAVAGRPRGQHPVAAFFARFTPAGGRGSAGAASADEAASGGGRRRRGRRGRVGEAGAAAAPAGGRGAVGGRVRGSRTPTGAGGSAEDAAHQGGGRRPRHRRRGGGAGGAPADGVGRTDRPVQPPQSQARPQGGGDGAASPGTARRRRGRGRGRRGGGGGGGGSGGGAPSSG